MKFEESIKQLLNVAIEEDVGIGDLTSQLCLPKSGQLTGWFILKQAGIIAGLPFVEALFKKIDPSLQMTFLVEEGSAHKAGAVLGKVSGSVHGIFAGERIALNLLQHTSGIASLTAKFVKKLIGLPCKILDTRKTLPGLRAIEKYAVRMGGGDNHRLSLDHRFIIQNKHLAFLSSLYTNPIQEAIRRIRQKFPSQPIEVEITSLDLLDEAIASDVEAILLSRMGHYDIKKCIKKIRETPKKIYVKSSTLETVRDWAELNVDAISVDAITFSAQPLDIVMRIK